MNSLVTLTSLPIGVYILNASTYINNAGYASNLQFGLDGTTQNGNLQNIISCANISQAQVVRITVLWIQTSAVNVYFSASGAYNFQNIYASYVRIG